MSAQKGRSEDRSYMDWMSQLPPELHDNPLHNLTIPGSHDSMSYDLDLSSAIIEPDGLKKLSKMYCVRKILYKWARTQEESILKQLEAGVRYFDLRIARKDNDPDPNRLYFYHGLLTQTDVETILRVMNDWAERHPKEILILSFSHFKGFVKRYEDQLHCHLINFIKTLFGAKLCKRHPFPTLKSCWENGTNVIISYDYPANMHQEIWGKIPYYYGNSMDITKWQNNRPALESNGARILEALRKGTAVSANPGETPPPAPDVAQRCFQQLAHSYEEEYGGFRDAPKFPTPVNLMFLMSFWSVNRCSSEGGEALQMALHTLRMMARGGIHDHVAQGFHRYSTDVSWHVPHFEKMLYDQAQLAVAYITASQVSGEQLFAHVAEDILRYVSRDLSDKSGGFYSAEDADSVPPSGASEKKEAGAEKMEKREGAFCVWTAAEVRDLFPEVVESSSGATQADVFVHHYGVKEPGNVDPEQDPHGELGGQNVLIVRYSVELTAARFGLSVDRVSELLSAARAKMADVRKTRPRPHLDTKMLASWNGLMLSAYSRVGAVLEDKALLERAVQAATFLKENLWDAERQTVLRSCYRGEDMELQQISPPISGFLDDYAFLVSGLLDLYEASLQTQWLQWAEQLQLRQDELFWDQQDGGYFCSDPNDASILLQLKKGEEVVVDERQIRTGAEPSANSVSASNLLRLSHYTGRRDWLLRSEQLLAAFSDRLQRVPVALPEMVQALMAHHYTLREIVICGQREAPDTISLLSAVHSLFLPPQGETDVIYSSISSFTVTFDPQSLRVRIHPRSRPL
ncbi:hypothetical protein CesoFtcFv8_021671 [Champsocephalus esox]|uniref:Phosphatidylinositol-specific phospholipase C X domain-containing protein n=1 Tax=Champsocephalus esox TaxID=159716 RepID=A0AAN8BA77_9TELE|nr:hypothetical protein CesoFtcFv8_021671 [Champsocephalus esox]